MTSNRLQRGDADHDRFSRKPHRRKHSNPWRCLSLLRFGAYAIVVLLFLDGLEALVCEIAPPVAVGQDCPVFAPPSLSWVVMVVITMSGVACAFRGLLDHFRREHQYRNQLSGRRY